METSTKLMMALYGLQNTVFTALTVLCKISPYSDSKDSKDGIFHIRIAIVRLHSYYCNIFKTNSEYDYDSHVVLKHPRRPAYPNKAEVEMMGLKPQGKPWEK
jgi:hypothetical protein